MVYELLISRIQAASFIPTRSWWHYPPQIWPRWPSSCRNDHWPRVRAGKAQCVLGEPWTRYVTIGGIEPFDGDILQPIIFWNLVLPHWSCFFLNGWREVSLRISFRWETQCLVAGLVAMTSSVLVKVFCLGKPRQPPILSQILILVGGFKHFIFPLYMG